MGGGLLEGGMIFASHRKMHGSIGKVETKAKAMWRRGFRNASSNVKGRQLGLKVANAFLWHVSGKVTCPGEDRGQKMKKEGRAISIELVEGTRKGNLGNLLTGGDADTIPRLIKTVLK